MKTSILLSLLIAAQSSIALASTPPESVPGIDAKREGDLAKKVAEFYKSTNPAGCDVEYGLTTYAAFKLSSGSAMDEKHEDTTATYDAKYIATATCNTGSTFVGAYRQVVSAAVIKATRVGNIHNGSSPVVPTQPDQFTVVSTIADPAILASEE